MKTVFMYAGQGSQYVGMGKDLYENYKEYKDTIDSLRDYDVFKNLMENGPIEELSLTKNTQPCMAGFAAGVTNVLAAKGIKPDASCGLSLGEYGALYVADVLNVNDYVETVTYRGKVMHEAAEGLVCAMSAVLGMKSEDIEAVIEKIDCGYIIVANYNCPGQYVICGDVNAVEEAEVKLKEAGAKRCVRLQVSGPFHTKYMEPASEKLAEKLNTITINKPSIPVALNVTGKIADENTDIKENLKQQIKSSVRFENEIKQLINEGADTFVEIGPGKVLSGFVKKIAKEMEKEVVTYTTDTCEDIEKLVSELKG